MSNDFARQTADSRLCDQLQEIRTDRLVEDGDAVALQSKPGVDRRRQAHAVAGDGVVSLRDGLQPQIVHEQFVPRPNEVEALVLQLPWIEHGTPAEAFPEDAPPIHVCDPKATPQRFLGDCGATPQLPPIHRARLPMAAGNAVGRTRGGSAMREFSEIEIPDTAPYKEWLGMVGSMVLAVLVCAFLFSTGVFS
jgi:hypothetical protein